MMMEIKPSNGRMIGVLSDIFKMIERACVYLMWAIRFFSLHIK